MAVGHREAGDSSGARRGRVVPNEFTDLDQVQYRLTNSEHYSNQTARPFKWKITRADLTELLARIEQHEQEEHNIQHASPAAA
jgi:hypothetical protein